jgi:hypothetical protein
MISIIDNNYYGKYKQSAPPKVSIQHRDQFKQGHKIRGEEEYSAT